jgi:hypothetical protein
MSNGAELSLLEVRLCLTSIGFVQTNVFAGNAAIRELKASNCQNRFHVEDLER